MAFSLLDNDTIAHIASHCNALELSRLPRVSSAVANALRLQQERLWHRLVQQLQRTEVDEPRVLMPSLESAPASKPTRLPSWRAAHEALTKLCVLVKNARAIEQKAGHAFLASCILAGADEKEVAWLLEAGVAADEVGASNAPALYLVSGISASDKEHGWDHAHRLVPLLVEAGADVNQVVYARAPPFTKSSPPETALFSACSCGASREMIDALLTAGADARWACPDGWTALHMCVQQDQFECAEELLYKSMKIQGKARRADPNTPSNANGDSPYEMAHGREKKAALPWYHHCDYCRACQRSVDTHSQLTCTHPIVVKWCDAMEMERLLRNYGGYSY